MIEQRTKPLLLAVSAPSGAGKTTLCDRLLEEFSDTMRYSVSCTTREPREGELDGVDYHFLSEEAFAERLEAEAFIEHAEVHGRRYGTLKEELFRGLAEGHDILMDIDVQGCSQIRDYLRQADANDPLRLSFVDVFIAPPSMDVLESRLRGRGQDAEDVIARRLGMAHREMDRWVEYRYLVVNDSLATSYDALRSVFIAEQHRVSAVPSP